MHRAAYDALGLDWSYDAIQLRADDLRAFVEGLDASWRGLSLTMPLKRTVVPLLDSLDVHAQRARAANTLLLSEEGRLGFNTDVPGAAAALTEGGTRAVRSAVVLGGGATATSVLIALGDLGCREALVLVRDPSRAAATLDTVLAVPGAPQVEVSGLEDAADLVPGLVADLVVSTVPAAAQTPRLLAACAQVPRVFEVVYDPWPTPLARAALDSGRDLVAGIDLLAHQAALQVLVMTGESVGVDLLREAGRAELARRAVENGPPGPPVS
jgi:shikimate dehydrogenase